MIRFTNLTVSLLVIFLLVISICFTGSYKASAAQQPLPFDFDPGFGDLRWSGIDNDGGTPGTGSPFSGSCSPGTNGGGMNINDARSADGGPDSGDAYDTAWLTTFSDTFIGTGGVGDFTNNTYTAVPVNISGLDITYQLFFPDNSQCNRLVVYFDNNTGSTIRDSFKIATNFGSDSGTVVNATSSGGNTLTPDDRWIVTSENVPATDPVNTTVFFGPGNTQVTPNFATQTVCSSAGNQGVGVRYNISVPPNSSRNLMFFACLGDITGMGNTIEGALAAVNLFDSNNDVFALGLLEGLSDDDLAGTLNWNFGITTVPTLSQWGLIAMAGILGIVGFMVMRRKRVSA